MPNRPDAGLSAAVLPTKEESMVPRILNDPEIVTARLTLRLHRMDDFPAYRDAFATERLRYMGAPIDTVGAWAAFCRDIAQWELLGHGAWAVDLTETGELIGQVGVNGHPYFPEKELGWLLLPHGEGQGFASEAALAARDWACKTLQLRTLVSYIHEENLPSIRLAKRLGAEVDPDAPECPYANHLVFRHPSPQSKIDDDTIPTNK
jgi:RimJ/RimL family protein N-acetyltransferase